MTDAYLSMLERLMSGVNQDMSDIRHEAKERCAKATIAGDGFTHGQRDDMFYLKGKLMILDIAIRYYKKYHCKEKDESHE